MIIAFRGMAGAAAIFLLATLPVVGGASEKAPLLTREQIDATWDVAQERFNSPDRYDRAYARLKLQNLADLGERRAAMDLARRHRDGDGLPQKPICTLYWYLRAEKLGAGNDVTDQIKAVSQDVSEEEHKKIAFALESNSYRISEVCDP